jgi:protein-S-isoprenylcysteine O-methyltransferase Ste14
LGKNNLTVWGIVLLLIAFIPFLAFNADMDGELSVAFAFSFVTLIALAVVINLLALRVNMDNRKPTLVLVSSIFCMINIPLYVYSLIVGLGRVALYNGYLFMLLFVISVVAPCSFGLWLFFRTGLTGTRDRNLLNIRNRYR